MTDKTSATHDSSTSRSLPPTSDLLRRCHEWWRGWKSNGVTTSIEDAFIAGYKEAALSAQSEIEQRSFSPLERFALTILEGMREHPGDDMDGDTLFDAAEVAGLLCEVKANEPCSEHYCACAEVSDFPLECMRETDYLRGKLAKFRKEKANV